jgi:hypothetical protein
MTDAEKGKRSLALIRAIEDMRPTDAIEVLGLAMTYELKQLRPHRRRVDHVGAIAVCLIDQLRTGARP